MTSQNTYSIREVWVPIRRGAFDIICNPVWERVWDSVGFEAYTQVWDGIWKDVDIDVLELEKIK